MSLSRIALRLAAYEALNPFATITTGPWPTHAGNRVYDSRIDPVEAPDAVEKLLSQIEGKPIVTLYTEEQESEPYAGAEYPIDKEIVVLVAELMIAARGTIEVQDAQGSVQTFGAITSPATDREREVLLDILEHQVREALAVESLASAGALYRGVVMEAHHIHSVPQRGADHVTRLAARTVKFRLRVHTTLRAFAPSSPPATGLALLPEPLLSVALALAPGSTGAAVCASIAQLIGQPDPLVPLEGIDIFVSVDRGAAPTKDDGSDSDVRAAVTLTEPPPRILNRRWKRVAAWLLKLINWSPS